MIKQRLERLYTIVTMRRRDIMNILIANGESKIVSKIFALKLTEKDMLNLSRDMDRFYRKKLVEYYFNKVIKEATK